MEKAFTQSGYAIRADLLGQAQGLLEMNIERENSKIHTHNDICLLYTSDAADE